jgi:hypothetical protein
VTTTSDLSIDGLRAALDAEAAGVGSARATLPGLRRGDVAAAPGAHVRGIREPECRSTRAALHDYLTRSLPPRRARRLEVHLDGCARCIRAFIDIREASWARRTPTGSSALTITRDCTAARLSTVS